MASPNGRGCELLLARQCLERSRPLDCPAQKGKWVGRARGRGGEERARPTPPTPTLGAPREVGRRGGLPAPGGPAQCSVGRRSPNRDDSGRGFLELEEGGGRERNPFRTTFGKLEIPFSELERTQSLSNFPGVTPTPKLSRLLVTKGLVFPQPLIPLYNRRWFSLSQNTQLLRLEKGRRKRTFSSCQPRGFSNMRNVDFTSFLLPRQGDKTSVVSL